MRRWWVKLMLYSATMMLSGAITLAVFVGALHLVDWLGWMP